MNKKLIVGGVIVLAACAVILPKIFTKKPFADAVADPVVEVTTPETRDITLFTGLVGKVEPEDVVYVYPKASGEVQQVNVKAGDLVEEGDVICLVDTKQVDSAKNAMDSAKLTLDQAQDELNRQSVLYAGGGISQQAYEQYQNNVKSAQIAYDDAKTNYENQVSYSQIKAPISGLVEICNIEVFDQVAQSDLIFVISGQGSKVVSFSITERIRQYLNEGDDVVVQKDGEDYQGVITEVSFMADTDTGLFKAKARLEEGVDESRFPTGSMLKLYVISEQVEGVLSVPVDSVYYDGGIPYVYTYDPETSTLHKLQVEVGLYDSDWIEVKSGLEPDAQVLTTWSSELYEGTVVRLKETDAAGGASEAGAADIAGETSAADAAGESDTADAAASPQQDHQ